MRVDVVTYCSRGSYKRKTFRSNIIVTNISFARFFHLSRLLSLVISAHGTGSKRPLFSAASSAPQRFGSFDKKNLKFLSRKKVFRFCVCFQRKHYIYYVLTAAWQKSILQLPFFFSIDR